MSIEVLLGAQGKTRGILLGHWPVDIDYRFFEIDRVIGSLVHGNIQENWYQKGAKCGSKTTKNVYATLHCFVIGRNYCVAFSDFELFLMFLSSEIRVSGDVKYLELHIVYVVFQTTDFIIDDRDFRHLRSMHRISDELE